MDLLENRIAARGGRGARMVAGPAGIRMRAGTFSAGAAAAIGKPSTIPRASQLGTQLIARFLRSHVGGDSMKAYVMTTGAFFGLLVVVHLWRVFEEGPGLAKDPWYILITVAAAALGLWAWRVLRRNPRS